ncbi:MAG TPA: GGDEF domain-containing protein [Rugosimonospora sp.]|nr:GGDEF domain-containing protein [Rugosimonospora sp.]
MARSRTWRYAAICLYASWVAALVGLALTGAADNTLNTVVGEFFDLYGVLSIVFAALAWRHRGLDRATRRAWGVVGVGFLVQEISEILREIYPVGNTFPSAADWFRLGFVPVVLAGMLMLPMREQQRRARYIAWLDVAVVTVSSGMVLWELQIGPSVAAAGHIPDDALAAAIAYPALDLVLVFGALVVIFRGAAASARRPAALLAAAMLSLVVGDTLLGYQESRATTTLSATWQFGCWLSGVFLLAAAAFEQCRQASRHTLRTQAARPRGASALPYLSIALGYLLLLATAARSGVRIVGLTVGAIAITAVVIARQVAVLRENHELAVTDPLTGLSNRRHLYDRLSFALTNSARNGQTVAALLLDMNGFKQVNDTLGHESGDRLLVAFGQVLRRNVLGLDAVGRLGGDEFAVIVHNIATPDNAEAVVRRIITDLQTPVLIGDTPVQMRASIGIAVSRSGRLTPDELLHHADLAMYQAKQQARRTATTAFAHYENAAAAPDPQRAERA